MHKIHLQVCQQRVRPSSVHYWETAGRGDKARERTYISSSDAAWRTLYFPIHKQFASVMYLAVHLENGQKMYFTEDNIVGRINNPPKTILLCFFDLCKVDVFIKTLLYCKVPSYYVWRNNKFFRRKQGTVSYTHLDVYKRQIFYYLDVVRTASNRIPYPKYWCI